MKMTNNNLSEILSLFAQKYLQAYREAFKHLPIIATDKEWPSPCEQGVHLQDYSLWQPTQINEPLSFENVETALELSLHPDIKTYYTSIFSDSLDASCEDGQLSLLLPWSVADFKRLQENIIGHVLMKGKLKQQVTIFFAVTDNDEHILSVNNDSGEVWVEKVGCEPHKKIANSLSEFISLLIPKIPSQHPQ